MTRKLDLLSVIVPAYNRAALIGRTLESVLCQTSIPIELIVVDDGSTDDTCDVVRSFGERAVLLNGQHRGPGAARSLGLTKATGDYVAFLDSDDVWFPWTVETYADVLAMTDYPSFVVGKPFIFLPGDAMPDKPDGPVAVLQFKDYYESGDQWRWYSASSFVMHRRTFVDAGGFTNDWVNAEDADAAMRMGVAPGFVQITGPFTFGYRKHQGSAMSNIDRTLAGIVRLIDEENGGRFPGGNDRVAHRRRILTTYSRPLSLDLLDQGKRKAAWNLYRRTLGWNGSERRFKYLAGFVARSLSRWNV